ncbi:MAG: nucleotide sugar dehydrogenase [Myxococcales bacterium]|nr:nucleotide sugar dehydrogenase [Myxococcales bacterium]
MRGVQERVAIIGLGYVGLPVALGFARYFPETVGFDIDDTKIEELRRGYDRNGEVDEKSLRETSLCWSADPADLVGATLYIVAVPTPVDTNRVPDLTPLKRAAAVVGQALRSGETEAVVVFESTVYPGVTEDVCTPLIENISGLTRGRDFRVAYSPERINPGDQDHTLERIIKVVAGDSPATLERVALAYEKVVKAGVYRAPSIKVAEAAKVIENTQRDINIALMNELALIFDRMGIRTADVLEAAETKWNFLPFRPGLVGGHCIGVDPYYLTTKAQELGYQPEVILAGRRINDNVSAYIAQKLVKMLVHADRPVKGARVGILGLTFKENCRDLRNSKVPSIVKELQSFGIEPLVHDPLASASEVRKHYGLQLSSLTNDFVGLDGMVFAVNHITYMEMGQNRLESMLADNGVLIDVKSALDPSRCQKKVRYWSL